MLIVVCMCIVCCLTSLVCPVQYLITVACFLHQLPIRTGLHTTQSIQNVEQNKECLINVSKHKFSLVINGLTKTLQSVDSMVSDTTYHSPSYTTHLFPSYTTHHSSL